MASIHQIRAAFLEEIVLRLLTQTGYRIVQIGEEGTQPGAAGMEMRGRGCWHQIDAFAAPLYSPPFMYPLRLLLEAKCYESRPVDIRTVRAVVGTVMDISQNFFTERIRDFDVQMQRYNYAAAIFSTSGYAGPAQQFAAAHQIFLIDYKDVPAMRPVVDALFALRPVDFGSTDARNIRVNMSVMRRSLRDFLSNDYAEATSESGPNAPGENPWQATLIPAVRTIRGSYYGMIEGLYPVHMLSDRPLSVRLLQESPEIPCRIHVSTDGNVWEFEPTRIPDDSDLHFQLQFQLPTLIAEILQHRRREPEEWQGFVGIKREYLRFVDIIGLIGNRFGAVRLTLDRDWLSEYVERRRTQESSTNGADNQPQELLE